MNFEFWWLLLLPALFGLGWLAARIDIRYVLADSRLLPHQYFLAVNHLLHHRTDQAIEMFAEVVRNHRETIELQFALGHLFRQQGEVERAIRIHQRLLARPELSAHQQQSARYELAQDFLKAGLLDRAEELLVQLEVSGQQAPVPHDSRTRATDSASGIEFSQAAQHALLDLYQQEKDWKQAIRIASKLRDTSPAHQCEIAQFHCELAEQAMARSEHTLAQHHLQLAFQENRQCVRAHLLLGDWHGAQQQWEAAIDSWLRIESQDARFLALAAPRLLAAYDQLNVPGKGITLLKGILGRYPDIDLLDTLHARLQQRSAAEAQVFLREHLAHHPSMPGYLLLLAGGEELLGAGTAPLSLGLRRAILQHDPDHLMYHCAHCGFKARQYFWQCPACSFWESISPHRGLPTRPVAPASMM